MKPLPILIFILFLSPLSSGAQWYNRTCGTADLDHLNQQQFDCLWKRSRTLARIGSATTLAGSVAVLAGGITMLAADPCCSSGRLLSGYFVFLTGLAIDALGVPVWIVGSSRMSNLNRMNPSMKFSGLHVQLFTSFNTTSFNTRFFNSRLIPVITLRARF